MVLFEVNCSSRSRRFYTREEVRLQGSGQTDRVWSTLQFSRKTKVYNKTVTHSPISCINVFCHTAVTSWQVVVEEVRHGGPGGQEADAGRGGVEAEEGPHHHLRLLRFVRPRHRRGRGSPGGRPGRGRGAARWSTAGG